MMAELQGLTYKNEQYEKPAVTLDAATSEDAAFGSAPLKSDTVKMGRDTLDIDNIPGALSDTAANEFSGMPYTSEIVDKPD
eukprot:8291357-Ditylum_brightwellii.AAC.1